MKLGEIKLEALYLCFATPELCIDTESDEMLSETLYSLKNDSNYKDYLNASVGAINRCFAFLEAKGLVPEKRLTVSKSELIKGENGYVIDLKPDKEGILSVDGVFKGGDYSSPVEYVYYDGEILLPLTDAADHTVIYTPRIKRVFHATEESYPIPLPEEISNIIPYFVKGDIFRVDDCEEAERSMKCFTSACEELSKSIFRKPASLRSVYTMEG